jgi:fatty-acyl-CoA synthase
MPELNISPDGLYRGRANSAELTPSIFLRHAARIYPDRVAIIDGDQQLTYRSLYARCRQLADALRRRGITAGDTVSIIAPNVSAMIEAHFAVPMANAVLNPINYRLDAETIAYTLNHAETKLLLIDKEFSQVSLRALGQLKKSIPTVFIDSTGVSSSLPPDVLEYESFVSEGDPEAEWSGPADEWQNFMISYTSGTTGDPKGVVSSHRGAYLNAFANVCVLQLPDNPIFLWVLPIFHALGWCLPWSVVLMGGTQVCLRKVDPAKIFELIKKHRVSHTCAVPLVMRMLTDLPSQERAEFDWSVKVYTGGARQLPDLVQKANAIGFKLIHGYGLTEVSGPAVFCYEQEHWKNLPVNEADAKRSRQGIAYPNMQDVIVVRPGTQDVVPCDGKTLGEVLMRGNSVMKGYFKNPQASRTAFEGDWFHTGDIAVMHPDGYLEIRDRSKDIIISGGENISSLEIEAVLCGHPAVLEAAVVARPHEYWGEVPCAFVEFKPGTTASVEELVAWCKQNMAGYKVPRVFEFGPLPRTATGKIRKADLRL